MCVCNPKNFTYYKSVLCIGTDEEEIVLEDGRSEIKEEEEQQKSEERPVSVVPR